MKSSLKLVILPPRMRPFLGAIVAVQIVLTTLGGLVLKRAMDTNDRMLVVFGLIAVVGSFLGVLVTLFANIFGREQEQPKLIVSVLILNGISLLTLVASAVLVLMFSI
ncbi:MAG: hypothetical protein KC996_00815 [Phycisphaerales bacterium]|nr:hypothetical protein [Phycisphaerales bacterium]